MINTGYAPSHHRGATGGKAEGRRLKEEEKAESGQIARNWTTSGGAVGAARPHLRARERLGQHARNVAGAAAGGASWISVADQKRGFEGVLWYQDMSRVCPGCPQTTPREARKGSCIRETYGEGMKGET